MVKPYYQENGITIYNDDCRNVLHSLNGVNSCITSPPYWGQRDYEDIRQVGIEETPEIYIAEMVDIFRDVNCCLSSDGTVWLNMGDTYAANRGGTAMPPETIAKSSVSNGRRGRGSGYSPHRDKKKHGLKHKDLIGLPWRVALSLQREGWYLRQDIVWNKPNPVPESVKDRCTKSHEYIFLLSKKDRYYFDFESIKEAATTKPSSNGKRNKRSVWTVPTKPFKGAHFATFPLDLVKPCIQAGTVKGGIVLDPFMGSGTTLLAALSMGRESVGIEVNEKYCELAVNRIKSVESNQP